MELNIWWKSSGFHIFWSQEMFSKHNTYIIDARPNNPFLQAWLRAETKLAELWVESRRVAVRFWRFSLKDENHILQLHVDGNQSNLANLTSSRNQTYRALLWGSNTRWASVWKYRSLFASRASRINPTYRDLVWR